MGVVRHYHIKQDEATKKYFVSERHKFATIDELIEYHKINGGGLVSRLKKLPARLAPHSSSLFGKLRYMYMRFLSPTK